MKRLLILPVFFFFLCYFTKAQNFSLRNSSVVFTENKGQVSDQFFKPRPDILFSGKSGGINLHLKKNGISYQFKKVKSWKNIENKVNEEKVPNEIEVYRVDIKWLDVSNSVEVIPGKDIPGYENFYNQVAPDGIGFVKSYKEVLYKNIYPNIDLHYYEKDGSLKYDYIIAPYVDYKVIRMEVLGATKLSLDNEGNLVIATPLGTIIEKAPVVYQNNIELKARWVLKNNILSFSLEKYNPKYSLIIDPMVRSWGTYYGGNDEDSFWSSSTDTLKNIYITGYSYSNNSIATTGSFQSTLNGSSNGVLAQFTPAGVRAWATYIGGSGNTFLYGSCTTNQNNIYISGATDTQGTVMATSGAHQTNCGGGADAILFKFNYLGQRIWSTYYGGPIQDFAYKCSTDQFENVYITGITQDSIGSSVFASPGCHQAIPLGGTEDCFLAKFNGSGVRQWGTYYGDTGDDKAYACAADNNGNVYMTGWTTSSNGIVTPGTHQTVKSSANDAFLVKFNTNGVRQWGTYYGGNNIETMLAVAPDNSGNLYVAGYTYSTDSIASQGSHQPYLIGTRSLYLTKFNGTGGNRLWGTYYGGSTAAEMGFVTLDKAFNPYIFGGTGNYTGTIIATPGTYSNNGGGTEAFAAKFSPNGVRQWGTYYGGPSPEGATGLVIDSNAYYLSGSTQSTIQIASPGCHQSAYGGGTWDGFLVKLKFCPVITASTNQINPTCNGFANGSATISVSGDTSYTYNWLPSGGTNSVAINLSAQVYTCNITGGCGTTLSQTIAITQPAIISLSASVSNPTICAGQSSTLTANASGGTGTLSYNWSTAAQSNTTVITPSVATVYTANVTDINNCTASATIAVTAYSLPIISANSGSFCTGKNYTITPNGASTYTFAWGSNTVQLSYAIVNPFSTTVYSITGTSSNGCLSGNFATSTVVVMPLPTVSVIGGIVCSGQSFTLNPSGASNYTFFANGPIVTPVSNTSYSVIGKSAFGCLSSNTAIATVTVLSVPVISVNSGSICNGQTFTIVPSGAISYTYSGGNSMVSPSVTSSFTVTGTSGNGCASPAGAISNVTVLPYPILSIPNATICSGQMYTIQPSGAVNYTYMNGGPVVSPSTTQTYSLTGSGANGCVTPINTCTVMVNNLPVILISSNDSIICVGDSTILFASGANTYTWSNTLNTNSIVITPTTTTTFSVNGTDINGCESYGIITQSVSGCAGFKENLLSETQINIFPNPGSGVYTIEFNSNNINSDFEVYNSLGQLLFKRHSFERVLNLSTYSNGIYFIKVLLDGKTNVFKVIKA